MLNNVLIHNLDFIHSRVCHSTMHWIARWWHASTWSLVLPKIHYRPTTQACHLRHQRFNESETLDRYFAIGSVVAISRRPGTWTKNRKWRTASATRLDANIFGDVFPGWGMSPDLTFLRRVTHRRSSFTNSDHLLHAHLRPSFKYMRDASTQWCFSHLTRRDLGDRVSTSCSNCRWILSRLMPLDRVQSQWPLLDTSHPCQWCRLTQPHSWWLIGLVTKLRFVAITRGQYRHVRGKHT